MTKTNIKKIHSLVATIVFVFFVAYHFFYQHIAYATYVNNLGIIGDFEIENDTPTVYAAGVTLNMDLAGVTQMRFGNTPTERDSAAWESYASTKSWTLTGGFGKKTVYAAFQNASSNTLSVSDDIIYADNPTLPYTTGLSLWLDANDTGSITESAGNVSIWNDKSGNNYHARQNNSGNQANLVSAEIDFNGSSDYFYLESLNYTSASPMDGLLVCSVFRTTNTNTSISGNWAFLDFDRSEWFNFYNRGDGIGFSYDAGGIQDMYVSGVGINDNNLHVSCASYDNSLTNDTVITVDGVVQLSENREAGGSQIGVGQATRYGFVGDGSEAATENAGRNNSYYDGGIAEIVYFDTPVADSDRQDIECYLGNKWGVTMTGCPVTDTTDPIATVSYSPEFSTSSDVVATLTNASESITITNNGGSNTYSFTTNGNFSFEFEDSAGNTGSVVAQVDWINPSAPPAVGTGGVNEAPIMTSYTGATTVNIGVGSGVTDVALLSATDNAFNIIGEYGNTTLAGNSWLDVSHNEMCSPVVVASHRQLVNAEVQRAPRVRNKTGTGFQLQVDNYNSSIGAISTNVDYIVMTAGSYDFGDGLIFEAGSNTTSAVACNATNNPTPDAVSFSSSFSAPPVVVHTVSTQNDATWVVSGVNGNDGSRQSEPSITQMGVVLQRSFNSCTHAAEDVDYVAFEPGHYSLLDGSELDAVRSTDSIQSVTTSGNAIDFFSSFSSPPQTVLVSQLGEDGGNGGYAQVHTNGGVTSSQVFATIDEDGPGADRNHTTEVASSVAFDGDSGQFWEANTLTYSITGGADSSDFSVNPSTGDLDFISGKDPNNYSDANTDGIYEVVVSVCDSHCNSLCDTQTFLVDVSDGIAPVIDATNFSSGALLPGGNHNIVIDYHDDGVGIDTASASMTLHKWDGISSWGSDISGLNLTTNAITSLQASYSMNDLDFGKYQYRFEVSDVNGNTVSQLLDFYIDIPEFIISTGSIDIGVIDHLSESFSDTVTVTVRTLGAGFDVTMNTTTLPNYSSESLSDWDGSDGFGYQASPFSGTITAIAGNQNIASQVSGINTNGDKNTYTYDIQLGALTQQMQAAGDYEGEFEFGIFFHY